MFTGLIEGVAKVVRLSPSGEAARLRLDLAALAEGVAVGDSVAVNGACLTATLATGPVVEFDVSAETMRVTTLGSLRASDEVNIERPLRVGDRLGGHFVLGHVDAVGAVAAIERAAGRVTLQVSAAPEVIACLVPKGSIAVDGISLTVADIGADRFSVAIIPHTLRSTTLHNRSAGDRVNIELDVIGKYVARLTAGARGSAVPQTGTGLTEQFLQEHGFK